VLEAQKQAVENILEDIDEHDDANSDMWGNHNKSYFEKEFKKLILK
jgi:hypothetical protein